ncbi:MFS general substrate transporter [Dentipellis sp. KUC8613]|nr:MFS general substrate transporter [Dentipellis sp. KUC8613]
MIVAEPVSLGPGKVSVPDSPPTSYHEKDVEKDVLAREESASEDEAVVYIVDPEAERKLIRRLDIRIIPASMYIYVLCFLDRSNVGNAKILNADTGDSLAQSLHISNNEYNTALMVFFIAYAIFQVPSNYMLKKLYPSRWMAFLMTGWGGTTMILAAVKDLPSLTGVRFLLGAFEAGLFAGIVYFLTFWYKPRERSLRIALISACATLGGGFGGSIAFGVGRLNRAMGLEGWRWLVLIEGAPTCASAILVYFLFPDYPETVSWLSPTERELAINRIKGVASLGHSKIYWAQTKATLLDWRLWFHYLIFVAVSVPFSSISLFAPTIVAGLGFEGLDAQLFTVPPYAIGFVVTVVVAWICDRYEKWSWGAVASFIIASVSFFIQGAIAATAFKTRYGMLCIGSSFSYASIPPLLTWLTANLRSTSAITLAVALNVTLGTIGQIIGVYIYKGDEAPGYPTGHFTNAGALLVCTAVTLFLKVVYTRRNRHLTAGERPWRT